MSNVEIHISKHGLKRIKSRCGFNKSTAMRMAEGAMLEGIHFRKTKGALSAHLMGLFSRYNGQANNIKVYNRYVYLFKRNYLITVLHLPKEYHKIVDKLKEEKYGKSQT